MIIRRGSTQLTNFNGTLRHHVRNLRAKVRLLLPVDRCEKQQHRNKLITKLMRNRLIQSFQNEPKWTTKNNENQSQFYTYCKIEKESKHMFHKLTKDQIEQIKQDKLYYIGEKYIQQFDEYLQNLQKQQKNNDQIIERQISPHLNTKLIRLQSKKLKQNQYKKILYSKIDHKSLLLNKNYKYQQFERTQKVKLNKKLITQQNQAKNTQLKFEIQTKAQNLIKNMQKVASLRDERIYHKNKELSLKIDQSIINKKKYEQEMVQMNSLSEKLRNICLSRSTKTANIKDRQYK